MKRGHFNLGYTKLFSCDMGELIPCGLVEVLPGDSFQMNTQLLLRASPMLAPVMHPVQVRIHHWFVPMRLVWDSFQDFITGGPAGTSTPTFPTITSTPVLGTLADYLGVPTGSSITYSALPFRAYQLIWNEWYRDQDLESAAVVSKADGNDTTTSTALQFCAWEKDYYTSSRPWEQKGPAVTIPIGTDAPLKGITFTSGANMSVNNPATIGVTAAFDKAANTIPWPTTSGVIFEGTSAGVVSGTNRPKLFADLSVAGGVTINQLRQAAALQRFEENAARYGSRYTEYLRRHGVRSSDARLQRPEYLGGGRQTIQFSEILQTAADGTNPVGTLRGHGISAAHSNRYRRFFEEHGYCLTFVSVRPKTIYMQGLKRTWNRRVKEDFWQRELEGIGQQKVLNKEVYAAHTTPDGTFGYQDRYDEYRRQESEVSGEFRTSLLNYWHMAREFASDPALNQSFVKCVPTERVFAIPSSDNLYIMARHNIRARRLVSQVGRSYLF